MLLLLTVIFSFITSSLCKKSLANQCASELAGIVYSPNYEYKDYLIYISEQLKNIASFYNTTGGQNYVSDIADKYNIAVLLIDAMGNIELVDPAGVNYITTNERQNVYSNHDARSVMNLGAYQNALLFITYAFLSFSKDGTVLQVTLAKPTAF